MNQLHVYTNYQQARSNISELMPVDYFLAKEVCASLLTPQRLAQLPKQADELLFHLVLALSHYTQMGHTCLPLNIIANSRFGFACHSDGTVQHQGYIFPAQTDIVNLLETLNLQAEHQHLLVLHQQALYLRRYFIFEQELAQQIQQRRAMNNEFRHADIANVLSSLFTDDNQLETDWQKVSVANALNKNFSVIAGGPGTGKTYTVTKLLAAYSILKQQALAELLNIEQTSAIQDEKPAQAIINYALVAPTGKAAQRLSESIKQALVQFIGVIDQQVLDNIPTQALTIHRLLGYIPNSPNFKHNENNRLHVDFLLIDEASMVDLALLTRVFRALPAHTKIVLLGDADQLPAVAVGNVLADIAPRPHLGYSKENQQYLQNVIKQKLPTTKKCPVDYLTFLLKSRRFDGEGGIGQLAKAVINGDSETSWQLLTAAHKENHHELALLPVNNEMLKNQALHKQKQPSFDERLVDFIEQYYVPLFKSHHVQQAFQTLNTFRILCATRKGHEGVERLNEVIKQHFIKKGLIRNKQTIYHAMPILITENNHKLGVYNGDIGIIWRNEAGHLMAMFEHNDTNQINVSEQHNISAFKAFLPSRLPHFEPVYAMTIHKTQGSEFTDVLMVIPNQSDHKILSRELLYTGITRAKKRLIVASKSNVWRQAVESKVVRYSQLTII